METTVMLYRFSVKNFKGFDKTLVLDFSANNYSFNQNLIKNVYFIKSRCYNLIK